MPSPILFENRKRREGNISMKKDSKAILTDMTVDEKISLACGHDFWKTNAVERLGIPQVMMCDGPHGLRKQKGQGDHLGINESIETVCYPSASALAASFDTELMEKLGETLGEECQAEDVGMLLGPGVNMKRSPVCGRNFEYFSEDPYLAGKMAASYVQALQKTGVAACVKHFATNNQETLRMSGDSRLSERALHETYLPAFEAVVKEGGTRSIMCAYNAINGEFCSVNEMLLTKVLRDRWGFDGFVVTDWGAGKDAVKGIKAGLDLHMPGGSDAVATALRSAYESGELTDAELDRMAGNMVRFALDYTEKKRPDCHIDRDRCAELSAEMAGECAVLLKNDGVLPLKKSSKVAFIGEYAAAPRYQGSGSSHINTKNVVSALDAAGSYSVSYAKGFLSGSTKTDEALLLEAVEIARTAETAVVFAGLPDSFESEGFDRDTLAMPANQNALIEAVAAVNPNTVVVLHGGAPMLTEWIGKVKAVLCMYLGGQGVGKATVQLLYGEKNPSGKLAETWPKKLSDNPAFLNFPGVEGTVDYAESVFIGYRYYDKKEMDVLFPFGHGLSYTDFLYSDLCTEKASVTDEEKVTVTCKVKNAGRFAGKETVQLYVKNATTEMPRPIRELRGFAKVELLPGEEKEVSFTLDKRSFAYYEEKIHDFYVPSGVYGIEIGASCRDIRLSEEISVTGTVELPYVYTLTSTVGSLMKTAKGQALFERMMAGRGQNAERENMEALGEGAAEMARRMMLEMPLGALTTFGGVPREQLEGMIAMLNS